MLGSVTFQNTWKLLAPNELRGRCGVVVEGGWGEMERGRESSGLLASEGKFRVD